MNAAESPQQHKVRDVNHWLTQRIIGQQTLLQRLMMALLCGGHLLVEGAPGLAKTRAVKELANAVEGDFHRIQFTPDLLPSDITGTEVFRPEDGTFKFQPGPVFHNLLLADEVNRAPAKVQSALLEAMAEHQVSVGRQTFPLPDLFLVMATQNPIEQEGTYPLPEAQMDRFLMKLSMGYPTRDEEKEIGRRRIARGKDDFDVARVTTPQAIVGMQQTCERLHIDDAILEYIANIVVATRKHEHVQVGSSPRGTLALIKAGRAWAALQGRAFVTPDDVRRIGVQVLAHRIILKPDARFGGTTSEKVIQGILKETPAPTA
jgi:MoxR-like ATPase